jgi:hypothetical protein
MSGSIPFRPHDDPDNSRDEGDNDEDEDDVDESVRANGFSHGTILTVYRATKRSKMLCSSQLKSASQC